MKKKSTFSGPPWGGKNWKPGKQEGTWFRHDSKFGPLVHSGDKITILSEKKALDEKGWKALVLETQQKGDRLWREWSLNKKDEEKVRKLSVLKTLLSDVVPFLKEEGWSIKHSNFGPVPIIDGIQEDLYPFKTVNRHNPQFFADVCWGLFWKDKPIWFSQEGVWKPALCRPEWTKVIDTTVDAILGRPLDEVRKSCENICILRQGDTLNSGDYSIEVLPAEWIGPHNYRPGVPVDVYPLTIKLKGDRYWYHFKIEAAGSLPKFDGSFYYSDPCEPHHKYSEGYLSPKYQPGF